MRRAVLLSLGSSCLLSGCVPATSIDPAPSVPRSTLALKADFSAEAGALPRYRSKRLAVSLPLPRGAEWRIDDHSSPDLVATHPATKSRVVVAILRSDAIVGRSQCEDLARTRGLVPAGPLQTVADEALVTQGTFDTRVEIALIPGDGPDKPLIGHVLAFGGYLRKCYVFDYSTSVASAAEEATLSSRLAFARARILDGLALDTIASLPRAEPHP